GQIGDAETALAQHTPDDIPAVQHRPSLEGDGVFPLVFLEVKAAVGSGTLPALQLPETVIAEMLLGCYGWHSVSLLFQLSSGGAGDAPPRRLVLKAQELLFLLVVLLLGDGAHVQQLLELLQLLRRVG